MVSMRIPTLVPSALLALLSSACTNSRPASPGESTSSTETCVYSNGLIAKTAVASRFRHVSLKALDEFNDIVRQVIYESHQGQDRLTLSTQIQVNDPLATIGSFNRQFLLTKRETEAVERAWIHEQGGTMFHVINAYTRAAHEADLTAQEAYKLERIGGVILSLVKE